MFRTEAEMTTKANDFLFKIKTQYGGREYGLNFVWKSSFLGQSKFIVEAFRHHQYVFVTGNSRRKQDVYKGQIRVGYEVEDKAPVILLALEGSRGRKIELEKILKWLRVRANTPGIQSSVITTDNNNRFGIKGQTAFGSKKNQLTLNFNITKPITLETFQSQWDLTTPMKDFQKVTGRISHQMHPVLAVALRDAFYALPTASQALYLLTFVDGIEELLKLIQPEPLMPQIHHSKTEERKDNVADGTGGENVLAGKDRSRDMKVGISITSNLPNVESILLNFVHKGHGQYYESDLTFEHGHQFDDTTILSPENGGVTAARSTALSSRQYGIHVSYAISSWKRNLTVITFTPAPQGEQKSQVVSGKNGNDAIVGENADSTPRVGFLQNCNSLQDSRYNIRTHLKRNPLKSNAFAAVTLEYGIDSEQLSTYEIVKTVFPMFTSFVTSDKMVDCTGNSDDSTSCKGNVSVVISGGFRYLGHSGTDLDSICFHLLHHGYSSKHWTSSAQLGTSYFEGLDMAVNYICSDVTKTSVGIDGNDHSSDGNSIPHYVNLTFENGNSIPHYVKLTFEKSALKNMTAHLQSFSRHQYRDVSFSLIRGDESQVSEQKDGLHNAAPSGDSSALKLLFDYDSGLDHFQSSIAIRCPAAEDDLWRARVHCFSLLNVNCTCYLKAPVTHIPGLNLLSRNNKTSHESIPSLTSSEHLTISSTLSSSCMQTDLSTCNAGNKTRKFSLDIVHPWSTMGAQYSLVKTGISQTEQRRLSSGDEMQERLITQSSTSTRIDDNFVEEKCFKMKAGSKSRTVEFTAKESNLPAGEKLREIGVELLSGLEKLGKILVFEMKTLGGDASNVDVKLHLPVQKIHFTTNLTETKGIKVWNSTARLASSLDNRLDWIITSQVINHKAVCSLTEIDPCLYKFTVSLTRPICELDTGLSSEFSFGKSNYSASLNSWYTIQHQKRQELTWQGMVTFQVLTPANDGLGNAQTTRKVPLRIEAATRYKSSGYIGHYVTKHHATDFSLDFPKRFMVYKTTSFPGQEEHLLVLEAASVNESVLVARAFRDFKRDTVPDVLLDVRLAAPTLLRVNLEWRQQTLNDLQEYLVSQLTSVDGCRSLRSYLEVIRATGSDLGSKYSAAASSVRENGDLQLKGNAIGLGNLERQLTNFIEEQVRMRTALSELVDATVRLWHGSGFDPEEVLTGLNSVWQDVSGAYDNLCVNIKHWTARLLHYAKTYPLDSFSQYFSNPQSKSQKTSPLTDTIQEQSVDRFMKSIPEPFRSQLLCVFMQTGTVIWSPGDGKLLAEICLPVPVQFLRVLPTVDDYTMTMRRAILQYVLGNWTHALDGTGSC